MQAVYTNVQVSNVAANGVYPIDAVNVLEAVKNLNEGDTHAEEQHWHEAAVGLVQMQEAKGRKSKLKQKSGPPLSMCMHLACVTVVQKFWTPPHSH